MTAKEKAAPARQRPTAEQENESNDDAFQRFPPKSLKTRIILAGGRSSIFPFIIRVVARLIGARHQQELRWDL